MAGTPDRDARKPEPWGPRQAPFVGRASELAQLTHALGEAARGRGAAFALVGEAGIGKTRLADEILEVALDTGLRVGIARCTDLEGAPAFWPWIEVLRGLARSDGEADGVTQSGLEELYALLSYLGIEVPPVPAMGDEARFALLDAVVKGITRTAAEKPLVLLLDDLHWADADSIFLLRELARRCERHPLLLIGTYRDEGSHEPPEARRAGALAGYERSAQRLALEGLDADGAARFVAWSSGREPSGRRVQQLLERSGGNPLFLGELAEVPDHAPLPESIRHALAPRLATLSPSARELLRFAAVLGQNFELEVLIGVTGKARSAQLEAFDELLRRGLLRRQRAGDDCAFAHALIHETAYEAVPVGERASMHARVAALLESAGPATTEADKARRARHLAHADDVEARARAVEYAAGAAALAREGLALHRAADHLGLALRAQRTLASQGEAFRRRRLELLLALGEAQAGLGAQLDAQQTYDEAAELARGLGDATRLGRAAAGWIGFQEAPIEFSAEALSRLEEALAALEHSGDDATRAGMLALAVQCLWYWRRRERCEAVAREAVACAERGNDPTMRVHALISLHRGLNAPEQAAERLEACRRAVALAVEHAPRHLEAMARRRLATDLLLRGDVAEARLEITRAIRIWEELRRPVDGWAVASLRAGLAMLSGDLDEAERSVADVWRLGNEAESRVAPVLFAAQLFRLRAHQGRLGEILELLRARTEGPGVIPAMTILVPLALVHLDRREEARESFERVVARDFDDFPRDDNWAGVLCAAAQIVHHLGDADRAAWIREMLLPFDGQHIVVGTASYWGGAVSRYLALLEATLGRAEAGPHFEDAIASHRRSGARVLLAETLEQHAAWLAERGEAEAAAARWSEAGDLFRSLGLGDAASRIETSLEALGARPAAERAPAHATQGGVARLQREGARWRVEYDGATAWVEDRKGLHDLALLLAVPGRELHVLDLMERSPAEPAATEPGLRTGAGPSGDGGLDARARAAYRARHAALRADLDDAEGLHDAARARALREEIAWLESELRGALRRGDGPAFVQRARKAVYNRIRAAIQGVERAHPELGHHLRHGVQTGELCRYVPEKPLRWEIDAGPP